MIRFKINFSLVLVLSLFVTCTVVGQSKTVNSGSVGNMYVPSNATISIFGQHSFASGGTGVMPGIIATAKNANKGIVNFAKGSSWTGANHNQFIDGYVRVAENDRFVFPIGSNGQYKPVMVTGGKNIEAAYFDENPQNFSGDQEQASTRSDDANLSTAGYWHVKSDSPATLTLFWNHDDVSYLNGDVKMMTIYGWNGQSWTEITSKVDEYTVSMTSSNGNFSQQLSNDEVGSLTSTEVIDIAEYEYFTIGRTNDAELVVGLQPEVAFFPNPVMSGADLQVDYEFSSAAGGTISIINPESKSIVATEIVGNQQGTFKFSNGPSVPGVYLIGIFDDNGNNQYRKLIVVNR